MDHLCYITVNEFRRHSRTQCTPAVPLHTAAYGYFFHHGRRVLSAVTLTKGTGERGGRIDPCVQTSGGWKRGTGLGNACLCRAETIDKLRAGAGKSPAARGSSASAGRLVRGRRRISPRPAPRRTTHGRPITASPCQRLPGNCSRLRRG